MYSKQTERFKVTTVGVDESQHKAAKVTGFTYLISIAIIVISNYSVTFRFIVPDAAETARNLVYHETLFRLNIVGDLIYLLNLIVMSTSLYILLKPVNKNIALATIFIRLIYALMWGIVALNIFYALQLLNSNNYLSAFETNQLQALSMLHLNNSSDAYYVGLPFWGIASLACSYLFLKSKFIPKALAVFGIISSAWCVFCAFTFIIYPDFDKLVHAGWFDMPMVIFETTLGFWLLFSKHKRIKLAQPILNIK